MNSNILDVWRITGQSEFLSHLQSQGVGMDEPHICALCNFKTLGNSLKTWANPPLSSKNVSSPPISGREKPSMLPTPPREGDWGSFPVTMMPYHFDTVDIALSLSYCGWILILLLSGETGRSCLNFLMSFYILQGIRVNSFYIRSGCD